MKKVIGVTPRTNILNDSDIFNVYQNYFDAIIKAGGIPVMLPIAKKEDLKQIMNNIDGLLITGGKDINPNLYNEEVKSYSILADEKEDNNDLNLIEIALNKKIPILGICKGLQILNVYFGGSLYQDIFEEYGTDINHSQSKLIPKPKNDSMNYNTKFNKNTLLYNIFGDEYTINSFHHQAIKDIANNFTISSISTDGIIEAIEDLDKKILAVQWHPERLVYDSKHFEIFKRFINMC